MGGTGRYFVYPTWAVARVGRLPSSVAPVTAHLQPSSAASVPRTPPTRPSQPGQQARGQGGRPFVNLGNLNLTTFAVEPSTPLTKSLARQRTTRPAHSSSPRLPPLDDSPSLLHNADRRAVWPEPACTPPTSRARYHRACAAKPLRADERRRRRWRRRRGRIHHPQPTDPSRPRGQPPPNCLASRTPGGPPAATTSPPPPARPPRRDRRLRRAPTSTGPSCRPCPTRGSRVSTRSTGRPRTFSKLR